MTKGDTGCSQHGHRKLGEFLETPLLQGEHSRGLHIDTDLMANETGEWIHE